MVLLRLIVGYLAAASLMVAAVQIYLILNKIRIRKHEPQVAASISIAGETLGPLPKSALTPGLHQNLQDALAEAGIEILSPVYHAVRDGNLSTIPAPHTPPATEAPAFRYRPADGNAGA